MENLKITHIDWKAIEDKYGNCHAIKTLIF